jgi:hypothetical protein
VSLPETQVEPADGPLSGYAAPAELPPFKPYMAFAGALNAGVIGALVAARRTGHDLPERIDASDLVLMGVATHKVSRLISKDKVTAFARAPFTEFQAKGGPAEVEEKPRGSGLRRAVGELLVCPYCLGLWASAAFHVGLVFAPRITRFTASIFAGLTISDFLQLAYKASEDRGLGDD